MPKARRKAQQPERRVRNDDITDREMLASIRAAIGPDGWATTTEIAMECGFTGSSNKNQTPAVKVASRLAYMRDGGLLESAAPDGNRPVNGPGGKDKRWRLSPIGETILEGQLRQTILKALEGMDAGQQVVLMRMITQRGFVNAEDAVAFAVRRECMHNLHQRKLFIR